MAFSHFRSLQKAAQTFQVVGRYCLTPVKPISLFGERAQNIATRSLWCLSRQSQEKRSARGRRDRLNRNLIPIQQHRFIQTKGDQELVQFLAEEITAETKAQKLPSLPKIEGFVIKTEGSSVTLSKKYQNENISIKVNVNHTVDTDVSETEDPAQANEKPEMAEMKSRPSFTVEIEKEGNSLAFTCSFVQDLVDENPDPDAYNDVFNVDEVVFHKGEWNESTYSVSGEIIDGYLYDLLMNYLEERGISSEFAEKLSNFCTSYEHKLYISLLENLKAFINGGK